MLSVCRGLDEAVMTEKRLVQRLYALMVPYTLIPEVKKANLKPEEVILYER